MSEEAARAIWRVWSASEIARSQAPVISRPFVVMAYLSWDEMVAASESLHAPGIKSMVDLCRAEAVAAVEAYEKERGATQ